MSANFAGSGIPDTAGKSAAPVGEPWMWTEAFENHEGRRPTHGYEATREEAMAAFAKSWRRL